MSSRSQNSCGRVAIMWLAAVVVPCVLVPFAAAQDQPTPKWEIFGGYSFFDPAAHVHGLLPGGLLPVSSRLESNPRGVGASVTYNFNRWFGLTADGSAHWDSNERGVTGRVDDAAFYNVSMGPKLTLRSHYFSPFVEALVGWHRLAPDLFKGDDRFGFMAGGGLDLNLNRHFALRLIRGDFVFSNHQYGPGSIVPGTDARGVRLQSGVVFLFGGKPAPPASASCTVNPAEVMVGEPATATATGSNFDSRHTLNYTWSSTGGQITGTDSSARVDTHGVAGGSYNVTAHISDPTAGSAANCMAAFTVREPPKNPPAVSCSADPSTVQTGTSSIISCTCSSPDNSQVTVGGWTASAGTVSSSGAGTAALDTAGTSDGPVTVSATCSDARGLNTRATAQVMVQNPPPVSPEFIKLEARLSLHSIYFATDKPRVEKPDGGLLLSQEQTLSSLAEDFKKYLETKPDAHLTLEGHADPRGSMEYNQALSERRVERTKRFLIEHGVPAAKLETKAFGEQRNLDEAQVKDAVEKNPELTPEQRQKVVDNIKTVLLASNRRVDITLSTTGQRSTREYPFNAADSLSLLQQAGTKKTVKRKPQQ